MLLEECKRRTNKRHSLDSMYALFVEDVTGPMSLSWDWKGVPVSFVHINIVIVVPGYTLVRLMDSPREWMAGQRTGNSDQSPGARIKHPERGVVERFASRTSSMSTRDVRSPRLSLKNSRQTRTDKPSTLRPLLSPSSYAKVLRLNPTTDSGRGRV